VACRVQRTSFSSFGKTPKWPTPAKRYLSAQWQHRDAHTLGMPMLLFLCIPNNWGIATELDAKGKLICYREQTRRI
jgi:hypothetical protein